MMNTIFLRMSYGTTKSQQKLLYKITFAYFTIFPYLHLQQNSVWISNLISRNHNFYFLMCRKKRVPDFDGIYLFWRITEYSCASDHPSSLVYFYLSQCHAHKINYTFLAIFEGKINNLWSLYTKFHFRDTMHSTEVLQFLLPEIDFHKDVGSERERRHTLWSPTHLISELSYPAS